MPWLVGLSRKPWPIMIVGRSTMTGAKYLMENYLEEEKVEENRIGRRGRKEKEEEEMKMTG